MVHWFTIAQDDNAAVMLLTIIFTTSQTNVLKFVNFYVDHVLVPGVIVRFELIY